MKSVLVVEDEASMRKAIVVALNEGGYRTFEAEDGLDAFAIIRELNGEISLLISELAVPNLDGVSLCRLVKELFPSVPVLLMSGDAERDACNVSDAFLWKPSQLQFLSKVVADFCLEPMKVA